MRHIEFLGPPGSGKSSLAGKVAISVPGGMSLTGAALASLRSSGADPLTRVAARLTRNPSSRLWKWAYARSTDRFAALTRFIISNPRAMEEVARALSARRLRDMRQDLVARWMLELMARYQLALDADIRLGSLVIDEGFCQRAVALLGYGFSPEKDADSLMSYLDAVPTPDTVVIVDTPLEVCESRLDHRGWSDRVAELDTASRRKFLTDASAVVEAVTDHFRSVGVHLISVNGTAPERDTVQGLVQHLAH